MRIGVASAFGTCVDLWLRLADEGAKVRVWVSEREQKDVGRGLVDLCSWTDLLAWCKEGHLSGEPTVLLFDSSGLGEKADEARRWGLHVVGGGAFCDRLEKDRGFGFKVAEVAGSTLPPYRDFSTFDAAREFAKGLDDSASVYWKSDRFLESDATHKADGGRDLTEYLDSIIRRFGSHGSCMIQEAVDGVALSTARWWNGKSFVGPFEGTIEHKAAYNDDIGPSTGCSVNVVWFYDDELPLCAEKLGWENLAATFAREEAPPGIYDINAVASPDGEMYFLEWTPRFGYDAEPCSVKLISSLTDWLWSIACGLELPPWSGELAYSIRMGVPPYPWEHGKTEHKHGAVGVEVRGVDLATPGFAPYQIGRNEYGLYVASPEGIVGLAYAVGADLEALDDEAQEVAEAARKTAGLSYRTDGATALGEDAEELAGSGFDVPAGLL